MKKASRTQLLDKAHIWSVRGLMGLTLFGCATITLQIYNYYTNVRPQKLDERRKVKELEIALEQEEKEAELVRRQRDAETRIQTMKKASRTQLLDKAHIWSVRGLMGLTLFGCATITLQIYNYYTNVRPQKLDERRKVKELEIALEQEEKEAELVRRQRDAETLVT